MNHPLQIDRHDDCVVSALTETVDLSALHARDPERYPFLLESVAHGTPQARYDILFAFPGDRLVLDARGGLETPNPGRLDGGFLEALDQWWRDLRRPEGSTCALPFRGGWFVFLGYELAGEIEPVLRLPAGGGLPRALAVRAPAAVIYDHERRQLYLMAEAGAGASDRLEAMAADVYATAGAWPEPDEAEAGFQGRVAEEEPERYLQGVERVKRYVRDGDVFQVNLSRQWNIWPEGAGSGPLQLYRNLRKRNPAPFAGLARWADSCIVSSSPERLVRVRGRVAETRPIAGTRPRGQAGPEDQALQRELVAHPKERAEHVMLIDLERNDLGRVCRPGSIEVNELMALETYSHVHHIVSNVRGELRADVSPAQVIQAVFPGGTITGCPKVRCMEIIAELEGEARGAYTGSMGYLNRDGDMDLNILIRTLVHEGDRITLRAGAGIVADSVPERELEETRAKARGLLLALGLD